MDLESHSILTFLHCSPILPLINLRSGTGGSLNLDTPSLSAADVTTFNLHVSYLTVTGPDN